MYNIPPVKHNGIPRAVCSCFGNQLYRHRMHWPMDVHNIKCVLSFVTQTKDRYFRRRDSLQSFDYRLAFASFVGRHNSYGLKYWNFDATRCRRNVAKEQPRRVGPSLNLPWFTAPQTRNVIQLLNMVFVFGYLTFKEISKLILAILIEIFWLRCRQRAFRAGRPIPVRI